MSEVSNVPINHQPREWRLGWLGWLDVALIVAAIVVLIAAPHEIWGDGSTRFAQLTDLLRFGRFAPGKYSIIGPLFATPLWFLGNDGGGPHSQRYCAWLNLIVLLLGCGVLLRRASLGSQRVRIRVVLLLLLASMFTQHTREFYGEVFTAVFAAVGMCWMAEGAWRKGAVSLALALANTPAALAAFALVVVVELAVERQTRWILPLVLGAALVVAENCLRFGTAFNPTYGDDHGTPTILPYGGLSGFSYPFLFGVLSICLSFGKGLLFFTPGLLATPMVEKLDHQRQQVRRTWLAFVIGLICVYAKWWSWYGGWFWGPRFLLFAAFPACWMLAEASVKFYGKSVCWKIGVAGMLALSFWVGANGYFWSHVSEQFLFRFGSSAEPLVWYTPDYSVLWYPFVTLPDAAQKWAEPPLIRSAAFYTSAIVFIVAGAILVLPIIADCPLRILRHCQQLRPSKQRWHW